MNFGKAYRNLFATYRANPNLTFLDSAATSLKPDSVLAALSLALGRDYGTVHRGVYSLARTATENYELARERIAKWLGASSSDELIFTRGTTDSINIVASGLTDYLKSGDEILLSVLEHHSNLVPWQMLAKRTGATLRFVSANALGQIDEKELTLSPQTRLVALAHMPNTTGRLQEFADFFAKARKQSVLTLLDGAQAISCSDVNVEKLGVDFYAFSAHKLYGPTGLGFLWGRRSALELLSPRDGGGEMVDRVELLESSYGALPLRLEAGTPPIGQVLAMGSVLDFIESFDREALHRHKIELTNRAMDLLETIPGVNLFAKKGHSSLLLASIEGVHPLDLATLLDLSGICLRSGHLCAQPALRRLGLESAFRISFGLYNDLDDIDRLEVGLKKALKILRR